VGLRRIIIIRKHLAVNGYWWTGLIKFCVKIE
jgi:hypothetical protein